MTLELAASYPGFPAAIVMVDCCIEPQPAFFEALSQVGKALRGGEYRQASRQIMESVCLPTDDPERKERLKDIMSSAPQHVMSSAFDHHR